MIEKIAGFDQRFPSDFIIERINTRMSHTFKEFLGVLEEHYGNCDFIKDPELKKACKKLMKKTPHNITYGGGYYGRGGKSSNGSGSGPGMGTGGGAGPGDGSGGGAFGGPAGGGGSAGSGGGGAGGGAGGGGGA